MGAATQKLRQWKQSINWPRIPLPRRARKLATRSAGPSSLASKWVTRQVARTVTTNFGQKSKASIDSAVRNGACARHA